MPSLVAAPVGPEMSPSASRSAVSIISLSWFRLIYPFRMGRQNCFVIRLCSLHDFPVLSSCCIASLISMPRFKLALTYEEKVGRFP
jgi:hypothetical protein